MAEYLLSVWGPADYTEHNNYEDEAAMQQAFADVDRFNQSLQERGHWVFAGGLMPASTATVVDGTGDSIVTADGPYLESKELIGGFWVVEAKDLDEALALAAEGSKACQGRVEVRPFQGE